MKTRHARVLAVALLLTGCDRFDAALTSTSDKVNAAFPLSAELLVAQAKLIEGNANQPAEKKLDEEQIKQRLQVRALSCAGTVPIGRFELASDIKKKLTDSECFKKQDAELSAWIGVRRLGVALNQSALRPMKPLAAKAILQGTDNASTMAVATDANVAVITGGGQFTVVDLSGGKPINSFQVPANAHRAASVSPNGRLLAVPISNRSLAVYEVESGAVIWSSDKHSDLIAWLPGVQAAVLQESGKAVMLDLRSGRLEPYLASEKSLNWSLDLPGGSHRKLVGSSNAVSVVDHLRGTDNSLSFVSSGQWQLPGRGVSAQVPFLMNNGKLLVYLSHPELGWLDMETGQQGTWAMSALRAHGFAKLDELNLLFRDSKRGSTTPENKLFNVRSSEVSAVREISATDGYQLPFAPRSGFAKAINGALVIHTTAQGENPLPLDQLVEQAQLEDQLAKLTPPPEPFQRTRYTDAEIATANAAAAAAEAAASAGEARSRTDRQAYIDLLSKQVRAANVASALRDGLPRDAVERIRNGTSQTVRSGQLTIGVPPPRPMLSDVPANAEVAVVGVYQGRSVEPHRPGAGSHRVGTVNVAVGNGPAPLVLVLSSYEPVRWNVQNIGGRKIAAILMSGYHESFVVGADKVTTVRIGSQHAYKLGSPEYEKLKTDISRYVGNPIHTFQGSYEGGNFSVRN